MAPTHTDGKTAWHTQRNQACSDRWRNARSDGFTTLVSGRRGRALYRFREPPPPRVPRLASAVCTPTRCRLACLSGWLAVPLLNRRFAGRLRATSVPLPSTWVHRDSEEGGVGVGGFDTVALLAGAAEASAVVGSGTLGVTRPTEQPSHGRSTTLMPRHASRKSMRSFARNARNVRTFAISAALEPVWVAHAGTSTYAHVNTQRAEVRDVSKAATGAAIGTHACSPTSMGARYFPDMLAQTPAPAPASADSPARA